MASCKFSCPFSFICSYKLAYDVDCLIALWLCLIFILPASLEDALSPLNKTQKDWFCLHPQLKTLACTHSGPAYTPLPDESHKHISDHVTCLHTNLPPLLLANEAQRLRLAWLPPPVGGGPTCLSFQLLLTLPWCPWETQLNLGSHTTLIQHSFPNAYHGNMRALQGLATLCLSVVSFVNVINQGQLSLPHSPCPMLPLF